MTRLRTLLSFTFIFLAHFLTASCPTDADVTIEKIKKDEDQLIITYSISGKYIYDITSITVFNKSIDSRINVESYTGDRNDLLPNKTYEIRWNVKQDVQVIERIKKSDFTIYADLTTEACNQLNRDENEEEPNSNNNPKDEPSKPKIDISIPDLSLRPVSFGFLCSPFMGFTFGNKSKARGLGLSYELGVFLEGEARGRTRFEIEATYARYGIGIDKSYDVEYDERSYDMKRVRMKVKTLNLNPSIKFHLENETMFSIGLTFTYVTNAQMKFKSNQNLNGENKYKNLSVYNESVVFPRAANISPLNKFSTGVFFTFEKFLKENQSTYIRIGGPLSNLLNDEYWDGRSGSEADFFDFNDGRLKFSYIQIGYKWRLNES